jgi:hypothetical protein
MKKNRKIKNLEEKYVPQLWPLNEIKRPFTYHYLDQKPKFKSVSVSRATHKKLASLAKNRFPVEVSVQTAIEFLLKQVMGKNWNE